MVNAPTTELQVVRTSKTLMYGALTWVTDHGWPVGVPESDAYEAAWRLRSGPGQNWVYIQ